MFSKDKLIRSNSRSDKLTGLPAASAQALSVSLGLAASLSETLRTNNDIVRVIVDQAVVGFVQSDLAGQITFANDRFCEITGYPREELLGKQWLELTHPDDRPSNVEYLERMKRDGKPYSFEKRYIRKNGEIIWVCVGGSQSRDAGDKELGGAVFVIDISKNKLALDDMRESEEKYRLLFENSRDALVTAAPPSWKFTAANQSTLRMFGAASEAEFTRLYPWDISPERQPDGQASAEKALQMLETALREGSHFFEWMHKRLDGRTFPAEVLLTRMERNGQFLIQATVRDISERKQAEELLRKTSQEIEDLYNHAPCGYHSLDKYGVICRINDTELEWLGYTRDELVGKMKWPDLLTSASQQAFRKDFPRFMERGIVRDFEIELVRKDGTVLVGLVNATAIYDPSGDYMMSRSTVIDITARKSTETMLRRSEENLNRAQTVGQIGSWVLDIPSSRLEWSAETFRMFDISPREGIDLAIFIEAIHPDDRDFVVNAWSEAVASDASYDIEHRILVKGQTRWVRERAYIERDPEGRPHTGIGTVQDITERKLAELELQKARESVHRDLLVREVHHRIKNNLQGITGVLRRHADTHPELAEPLNQAIGQVHSVAIIHGLQGRTGMSRVRLCELMSAVVAGAESLWSKSITIDIPSNWVACTIVESEAVPMALILNELIANALKHGGLNGDVDIRLRHEPNESSIRLTICNPGLVPAGFGLHDLKQLGTGLQLVASLMPQTGARLYWENRQEKVITFFELDKPVIHLESLN
jgi:PAS domain S-box-containing protein